MRHTHFMLHREYCPALLLHCLCVLRGVEFEAAAAAVAIPTREGPALHWDGNNIAFYKSIMLMVTKKTITLKSCQRPVYYLSR